MSSKEAFILNLFQHLVRLKQVSMNLFGYADLVVQCLMRLCLCILRSRNKFGMTMITLCSLILSGCNQLERCVDADDFGSPTFTISSRYTSDELSQQQNNQIAPWRDSGYRVNGQPLTIVVRTWQYGVDSNTSGNLSAWCPWYGTSDNTGTLSKFCLRLPNCTFIDGQMCTATTDAQISNAPCLLKNGVGLYALIATPGSDPNSSFVSQRSPSGITMHLGEPQSGYQLYDLGSDGIIRNAGGAVYQFSSGDSTTYNNAELYFKILDKYYDDNAGQYRVVIKSGIGDTRPDPISFLTSLVINNLFGTSGNDYGLIKNIYLKITQNTSYIIAVKAMLILYIIFTALSFLIGNLNITQTELIIRVLKIGIVSALISSKYSWDFFNNYLFVYFVSGLQEILQIIQTAGASGPGSTSIINLMIAPQTMAKLFSLLFIDWRGFIYIILFMIALCFVVVVIFKATIIYLSALIAIGMIIVMAPIFICFMLFNITRSLFENWLRQLISYAFQPIILFTGLMFISMIIRTEIYSSLGFKVCKQGFPNLGTMTAIFGSESVNADSSLTNSIFYWWFPSPMQAQNFTKTKANIPVPVDHYQTNLDGTQNGTFCVAYGCNENRYVELPFLDPNTDQTRLNEFWNGSYVQFDGLLLIFISIYLLSKFNEVSVSMARFLSNTSGNQTELGNISEAVQGNISQVISYAKHESGQAVDRKWEVFKIRHEKIAGIVDFVQNAPARAYERMVAGRLRKDALSANPNAAVLEEVKKSYGMDHKDLNRDAINDYQKMLEAKIKEANPGLSNKQLKAKAEEFAQVDYKGLKDKFAEMQFGKNYDKLNNADKKKLDDLLATKRGGISLKLLASDAKFARDFQDAYVDAYADLSGRGVGLLGKHVKAFRGWKELEYEVNSREELERTKRQNMGERLYARYEDAKRGLVSTIMGEGFVNNMEGGLTSSAWHSYDYEDKRVRTYSEVLADQQKALEKTELAKEIRREQNNAKDDVLKPEYLAKLEIGGATDDLDRYRNLAKKELSYEIHAQLTAGENPAIMGEKYIHEKATPEEFNNMVTRAKEQEFKIMEKDRYLKREEHYEIMQETAFDKIREKFDLLKEHYKRDDIKIEEMTQLMEQYYKEMNIAPSQANKDIDDLQKSIGDFEYSQKVLKHIDDRKGQIKEEIDKNIEEMYKQRRDPNYKKSEKFQGRQFKSLNET